MIGYLKLKNLSHVISMTKVIFVIKPFSLPFYIINNALPDKVVS